MFLADNTIQKLKCIIGHFNVKFDEKSVEKSDLQNFGTIK